MEKELIASKKTDNNKMENFNILEEKINPLFLRKEIIAEVQAESVPSHVEVEKLISEKFKSPVENFKIKQIKGKFGSNTFRIIVFIYKTKEEKENIEPKPKAKKAAT